MSIGITKTTNKSNHGHLFLYGLFFEVAYIILLALVYLRDYLGDVNIPTQNTTVMFLFLAWSLVVFFIYLFLIFRKFPKHFLWLIIIFYFIFSFTFMISWPFSSADMFNYVYRARVFTQYDQNPFLVAPGNFSNDLLNNFVLFAGARNSSMIYGPLWATISFIPNWVFKDNLPFILLSLKFIAVLFNFGCLILVYQILKILKPDYRHIGFLMYAWNPFLLYESAQNGHNDFVMIFFLLLAIYLLLKNKLVWVLPALTASVLVKYITLLLVPLFAIFLWKKIKKDRFVFWLKTSFLSLFLIFIFYLPFWAGFKIFASLFDVGGFLIYSHSILPVLLKVFLNFSEDAIKQITKLSFLLIYGYFLIKTIKVSSIENFLKIIFWVLLSFIAIYLTWVMPWYFIWPMIMAILLIQEKKYILWVLFLTLVAFLGYYIFYLIVTGVVVILFVFISLKYKFDFSTPFISKSS